MPELPEVETVRRTLVLWCKGQRIKDVNIVYNKVLDGINFEEFKSKVINQTINDVNRFGKYLFFILDDYVIISHLRMEGKYFFIKDTEETEYINKHKIITFNLNGNNLIYHDVRKFGKMKLANKDKYMLDKSIVKLGKEPFDLTSEELYDKLSRLNKSIKQSLLDQSIISGLGNIYVDEILFDCGIMPTRSSKSISLKECEKIVDSSIKILNKAIELKGSTIASYHFNNNESGNFQTMHKVYGKKGKCCCKCGRVIEKMVIGGRGTYYCPNCQK